MLRQKPLVISLILAGLIASTQAVALSLERLGVATALGQPLIAEIELSIASEDDIESIRANIATPAVYRAADVEYQGIVQSIRVQVLRRPDGKPYLRLVSSQSINDPYLDILVEINSNTGRLVREYVFLLDPPATAVVQNIEPTQPSLPATPAFSAPNLPPAPALSPAASAPAVAASRGNSTTGNSYSVKTGDTLFGIAGRNVQRGVTIEQMMITIQRSNPDAFINGNINRLRTGASLTLPSIGDAQAMTQSAASNEVRAQAANWRGYVARASDSVPNVASDTPSARAIGRVSGAVADTGTNINNSDKLKLSQGERSKQQSPGTESKVAAAKALTEEQSRAAQLKKIKQDLEKVLSLKNQAMADAQAKAQAAAKTTFPASVAATKVEPFKPAVAPSVAPLPAPLPTPVVVPPAPSAPQPVTEVAPPLPALGVLPSAATTPPATLATAAPAEPSMMDLLANNQVTAAAAAGVILLALFGTLLWHRSRREIVLLAHSEMTDPVINMINPDIVFGASGLGVVKTNDVPTPSQFSRPGVGLIDSSEIDPVAEAEVYIAYGREAQAEEILREALQRDSQRPNVATKLAEISATQGKRGSFDKLAADIVAMDRTGEYKQKLIALAAAHFPDHPLLGISNTPTTGTATTLSVAPTAATRALSSASFDTLNAPKSASLTVSAPPKQSSGSLDFVLDGITVAKPSTPPTSLSAPSAAAFKTLSPTATLSPPNSRKSLEDDLVELEASLKKATKPDQVTELSLDFNDFLTTTPINPSTVSPSMRPEMLDLSFDTERQDFVNPASSILDGQWHDASTKLDLARAYEEMGDHEGAREILREVIHDGDGAQIAKAKALLAKLGG